VTPPAVTETTHVADVPGVTPPKLPVEVVMMLAGMRILSAWTPVFAPYTVRVGYV
jgi:hypothetical protein